MMRSLEELQEEFESVAAMRHFGLELHDVGDGTAELRMPARPEYLQLGNVIHGGAITTLADTAAVYTIYPTLDAGEQMTSIELKLNFLRPARGPGDDLVAHATLIKRGRRVAVGEVKVHQGDNVVATGLCTYLVTSPANGS